MYLSLGKFKISDVLIRETFPWLDVFCFLKMTVFSISDFKMLEMTICS